MLASRRWRDWKPAEITQKGPLQEPPKPPKPILSVLSVHTPVVSEKTTECNRIPFHDPAQWREPFAQWLAFACAFQPRAFGGVAALHRAYSEWEIARNEVPCIRETFEELLRERGFLLGVVSGTMLVSELTFREDVIQEMNLE
jgi:hypothetical protein